MWWRYPKIMKTTIRTLAFAALLALAAVYFAGTLLPGALPQLQRRHAAHGADGSRCGALAAHTRYNHHS